MARLFGSSNLLVVTPGPAGRSCSVLDFLVPLPRTPVGPLQRRPRGFRRRWLFPPNENRARLVAKAKTTRKPYYDGTHLAIYVRNFEQMYENCAKRGLVWNNPRFPNLTYERYFGGCGPPLRVPGKGHRGPWRWDWVWGSLAA